MWPYACKYPDSPFWNMIYDALLHTFFSKISSVCRGRYEAELVQAAEQPLPDDDDEAFES
jgi:hypothetical protein